MRDTAREQGTLFDADSKDNIHRLNMGVFPAGAEIIPNPYNKIPGFSCYVELAGLHQAKPALFEGSAQLPGQPGPQNRLRRAAGAAAPSGGSDPHAVGERGGVHFLPGFPVMAWPMMEWVLDTHYAHLHQKLAYSEKSVIVFGSMEAMLTPLMLEIEAAHSRVKVFSLPSVDHAEYGRHIELGVKGAPSAVESAYTELVSGLGAFGVRLGPELVRTSKNDSN